MSQDSSNKIELPCPSCQKTLRVPANVLGKKVKCPSCSEVVRLPAVAPLRPEEDDWLNLDAPALQPDTIQTAKPTQKSGYVWEKKGSSESSSVPKSVAPDKSETPKKAFPTTGDELVESTEEKVVRKSIPSPLANRGKELVVQTDDLPPLPFDDDVATPSAKAPVREAKKESVFDDDDFMKLAPAVEVKKPSFTDDRWLEELPEELPTKDPVRANFPTSGLNSLEGKVKEPVSKPKEPAPPRGKNVVVIDDVDSMSDVPLHAKRSEVPDELAEFPLKCKVCGTLMYVALKQVGTMIRCPDCFIDIMVPDPPKGWSPLKAKQAKLKQEADLALAAGDDAPRDRGRLLERSAIDVLKQGSSRS